MSFPSSLTPFLASTNSAPPRHLGTRYDAEGRFLPEPGNTVVCHLVPGSPSEAAIIRARARIMALPGADRLAFTPVESLHMTLFQGIIEYRRRQPYWPEELPLDTPIDDMTALYRERLKFFEPGPPFAVAPVGLTPLGLIVAGAIDGDRGALATWRDRLADCFGYRHPDHDSYVFHITFAYMTGWLDDALAETWETALAEALDDLRRGAPVIDLAPPAFCEFRDMRRFEKLMVLG